MTLDQSRVRQFLAGMRDRVARLREIATEGPDAFRDDFRSHHAAMRLLQISIEDMINIGSHIIARRSYRAPKDFADVFRVLNEEGIISSDAAGRYARMARFRNRLVHVYWDVDLDQVYSVLNSDLGDFETYAESVARLFLEETSAGPGD